MTGRRYFFIYLLVSILSAISDSLSGQVIIDSITILEKKSFSLQGIAPDFRVNDSLHQQTQGFLSSITSGQLQINTPGGLTTFLHRGMGNRHLPVLWQGINLLSTVNGSYDLSLIPLILFNQSAFYQFGAPTLQGNNGFAGAFNVDHDDFQKGGVISGAISTLQNYQLAASVNIKSKKQKTYAGIQAGRDQNLFSYTYNQKTYERISTDFNKINLVISTDYYLTPNQQVHFNAWWQHSTRLIPTSVSAAPINQQQEDNNFRSQISHQYFKGRNKWTNKVSYLNEKINYTTTSIDSRAVVDVLMWSSEWAELTQQAYFLGINYRHDLARPNFYNGQKVRSTLQMSGSKKWNWAVKGSTNFSIRQDLVDGRWMPNSWTIHTAYANNTLNFSRNYNLPGLNDLYWPQGGNPNLKTETSFQAEIKRQASYNQLDYSIALYANLVDNWIVWSPMSSGLWSPSNQQQVWSRGLDMQLSKTYVVKRLQFRPKVAYSYNKTTIVRHHTNPDLIGKQMIYIPNHKVNLIFSLIKGIHHLDIAYQITSHRYDTFDNSSPLPGIHLVDIGYNCKYRKWQLGIDISNVLNSSYNYVRFFPMPGINSKISMSYKIF